MVGYVVLIVVSPDRNRGVGLLKLKGPSQLIHRLTFPGGKVEAGESIVIAASREMREETGLCIPVADWRPVTTVVGGSYELSVLTAESPFVGDARACEEEPVFVMDLQQHRNAAAHYPDDYAPEFLVWLDAALLVLDDHVTVAT